MCLRVCVCVRVVSLWVTEESNMAMYNKFHTEPRTGSLWRVLAVEARTAGCRERHDDGPSDVDTRANWLE